VSEVTTRTSIEEYLRLEASAESDTRLEAIEDINKVGHYYGFEVWQARLIFTGLEQWVWVIPEPVMNYYLHRGRMSDEESELGNADACAQ